MDILNPDIQEIIACLRWLPDLHGIFIPYFHVAQEYASTEDATVTSPVQ